MIDVKVPQIGESINEASLSKWIKKEGEYVQQDEVICELESEKATFELNAEKPGILHRLVQEGETVQVGAVLARIDETAQAPAAATAAAAPAAAAVPAEGKRASDKPAQQPAPAQSSAAGPAAASPGGSIDIKVPAIGESISEVTLAKWAKAEGSYVKRDEVICEMESEKASFELNAEQSGILHHNAQPGDTLGIGQLIGRIDTSAEAPAAEAASEPAEELQTTSAAPSAPEGVRATPVASAIMSDKKVNPQSVQGSGPSGKIIKQDVLQALEQPGRSLGAELFSRQERREKMSNLRKTISRRLVEAKNATAMLTTFNEVDMSRIMEIRKHYKDAFKESHQIGLGFMSFFTKACCFALQEWPAVNAFIDGDSLIYHDYCDVSVAVSTPRGLVVPVIRNAESLSMAAIEQKVAELAKKARDNKLSMEEMTGGTFTITNGGVFGSLMSTPILNIPQSAILGMHKIQERPVALDGQVVVRPMMYVALSYDHRVVDGRESVSFLVRVKELLEHPEQLLFGKDPVQSLLEL